MNTVTSRTNPLNTNPASASLQEATQVEQKPGQGIAATASPSSPPVQTGQPAAGTSQALASLSSFISGNKRTDVEVLLVQVTVAMRDTEAMTQKAKIETDQQTKRAQAQEKGEKLKEAQQKMQEAKEKEKEQLIADKVKLAFAWIGAVIASIAAAAMILTGAGAVIGVALAVAAMTSIVMAADSTVAQVHGVGIAGKVAMDHGASREEAAKHDMGFRIGMMVIGIVAAAVSGGVGIYNAVNGVAQAATVGARIAQHAVNIAQAASALGSAATGVASTVITHDATVLRADERELSAEAKTKEAQMQMLDDMIDRALASLAASADRFNQIMDDIAESLKDRGATLSRARLTV